MPNSVYGFRDIQWRDFLLIPIFIVSFLIFFIIGVVYSFVIGKSDSTTMDMLTALIQLLAYVVVVLSYYFLHIQQFQTILSDNWQALKRQWRWVLIGFVVMFLLAMLYDQVIQHLPNNWGYSETKNEEALDQLFKQKAFLPFTFILAVIVGPIVEELAFRHLLIGELGKKLNFIVMGVISALLFALIHLDPTSSPFEYGGYLIMGAAIVIVYLKTGRRLLPVIAMHMLNNFVAFILTCISLFH